MGQSGQRWSSGCRPFAGLASAIRAGGDGGEDEKTRRRPHRSGIQWTGSALFIYCRCLVFHQYGCAGSVLPCSQASATGVHDDKPVYLLLVDVPLPASAVEFPACDRSVPGRNTEVQALVELFEPEAYQASASDSGHGAVPKTLRGDFLWRLGWRQRGLSQPRQALRDMQLAGAVPEKMARCCKSLRDSLAATRRPSRRSLPHEPASVTGLDRPASSAHPRRVAQIATGYSDNPCSPRQSGCATTLNISSRLVRRRLVTCRLPWARLSCCVLRQLRRSTESDFPAVRFEAGLRLAPDPRAGHVAVIYCIAHVYRRFK